MDDYVVVSRLDAAVVLDLETGKERAKVKKKHLRARLHDGKLWAPNARGYDHYVPETLEKKGAFKAKFANVTKHRRQIACLASTKDPYGPRSLHWLDPKSLAVKATSDVHAESIEASIGKRLVVKTIRATPTVPGLACLTIE